MNNGEQFKIESIGELAMCYEVFQKEWITGVRLESEIKDFQEGYRFIQKEDDDLFLFFEEQSFKTISPPGFILQYREALKQKRPMRLEDVPIEISNKYLPALHDFVNLFVIWKSWGTDADGLHMEFGPEFYQAFKEQIEKIGKQLK